MCGAIDSVVDAWHGASAPVIDSPLGRAGLTAAGTYFGGPMGGALVNGALGVNDATTGHSDRLGGDLLRGGLAGFGGDMFGGGSTDTGAMPSYGGAGAGTELSAPASAGATGLPSLGTLASAPTPALSAQGLGDMGSSTGYGELSGYGVPPISPAQPPQNFAGLGDAPLGSGSSAFSDPNAGYQSLSQMSPTPTVGQGAPITGFNQPQDTSGTLGAPTGDTSSMWDKITGKQVYGGMQIANGLQQMFARQSVGNAMKDRYDQLNAEINNMYAPGSPEAKALAQIMARKDAAAGRNSQYSTQATNLQAAIAKLKADQTTGLNSGQNSLLSGGTAYQNTGLSSLFNAAGTLNGYNNLTGGA